MSRVSGDPIPCLLLSRETHSTFLIFVHKKISKNCVKIFVFNHHSWLIFNHIYSWLTLSTRVFQVRIIMQWCVTRISFEFWRIFSTIQNDRMRRNEDGLPIVVRNVIHQWNKKLDALTHSFISFEHRPPEYSCFSSINESEASFSFGSSATIFIILHEKFGHKTIVAVKGTSRFSFFLYIQLQTTWCHHPFLRRRQSLRGICFND